MVLKLRWSSVLAFAKCQRKYDYTYNQHLTRKTGLDTRARTLGSHVHAGVAAALLASFEGGSVDSMVEAAVRAVRVYNTENTNQEQTVFNYERQRKEPDEPYLHMMADILIQAIQIVRYQVPRLGIGTKYRVVSDIDIFGTNESGKPLVEWHFVCEAGAFEVTGTIDAVLQDIDTGEYVLVDWKTRGVIPDHRLIDLDGQLKLYAAAVNNLAHSSIITKVIQFQLRSIVPKPAKLTEKRQEVSVAAASSTWEVWAESLSSIGIDPEPYRAQMTPKLHPAEDFTLAVVSPVTRYSTALIINDVLGYGQAIMDSTARGFFPGIQSVMGCQFCDFKRLCATRQNGGDIQHVIDNEYEVVSVEEIEDSQDLTSHD